MNVFIPYLAALHQQDLLREAELERRARSRAAAQPRTPAWRRALGGLFASAARSLDPSVEVEHATPLPGGRDANLLPAC